MYNEYVRVYIHFYNSKGKKIRFIQSIKGKEDVIQINNEIEKYE